MKNFKLDYGTVYAEKNGVGYRVIKLDKESVQFGRKLTAKCKDNYLHTYLVGGPTRAETSEKVMIGHMNENGQWEGGRIDLFHNGLGIVYRKYENGEEVEDSLCRYNDYEWISATGKPLGKSSSFYRIKMNEETIKDITEKLFDHAKDVADLSPTIGNLIENVNNKRPELAMGLGVAAKLCK